jgi:phosphonoacetate hydrolase
MCDGLGLDYRLRGPMPTLDSMARDGFATVVSAVMPTVTNVNNVSICCAAWPEEHGITGNSYFDPVRGEATYMESDSFLLAPTIFERARERGIRGALLTAKRKTVDLIGRGAGLAITAEDPPAALVERHGPAPDIYSAEINHWLWRVAIEVLARRPDLGLLYVHTTDYAMHMWPPEAVESRRHVEEIDRLIGQARDVAPGAAFFVTADHGMNFKSRCWDLTRACAARGAPVRFSLSVEKDRYVRHHRTFGGTAWVWLQSPEDEGAVAGVISDLPGVELVLRRAEAARRFRLKADRIGDLVVIGDRETVFGELDAESETLPADYRSHGSLHEREVPLLIWNYRGDLDPSVTANADLLRPLVRSWEG